METLTCADTLGIAVAVADPDTVAYLGARYGTVAVSGWLHLVTSAP